MELRRSNIPFNGFQRFYLPTPASGECHRKTKRKSRGFWELPNKQERIFLSIACKKAKRKKIFDNERKPVEKHDIYIFHLEKCSGSRI